MMNKQSFLNELKTLLARAEIDPNAKYLTAKQIELTYGTPAKTILNRSNLPTSHRRYIPSVRLTGGRKKLFEKKVINRMFQTGRVAQ